MSGSTIIIDGVPVTIDLANFTEAVNFDFGEGQNWAPSDPTVIEINNGGNLYLVEADIDLAGIEGLGNGPITNPTYGVSVPEGEADYSSGLLVSDVGADLFVAGYLEIDWVGIQNDGIITVSPGGTLQANVDMQSTVLNIVLAGLPLSGGIVYDAGTINSGHLIQGGVFEDGGPITEASQGELSYNTTLEDLAFEGNLDLTKANYNVVNLVNVTFADYAGLSPEIMMNGTGGVLRSTGDQTLANVSIVFGSNIGTIFSGGTNSTLVIAPTTTLDLDDSDFYVANTDTLINQIELDSNKSNQQLSFAGQAFIEVILNPATGIYTPLAAGVFENEGEIVLSNPSATTTIFDIGFTNEAGALLSVTNATLGDHQFTSNFENAGTYDIGSNGTVEAYDQGFANDANATIDISADDIGSGTLALGTMDVQAGGNVFTAAPSLYVNNGLIELDSSAPSGAPLFYIGPGLDFGSPVDILFTNNGTISLGAGALEIQFGVTIDGGTIVGDGGTIYAGDGTIENATLTGEVNFTTQGGDSGGIWLYDDSFAANTFSPSIINVGQQGISLFLRDDFGLSDVVLNLGTVGDPRADLWLESTTLTIDATSTLNVDAASAAIFNGDIPNGGPLQTTLYNEGLMQALSGVLDISTTGFENSGQFTISDNVVVNVIGVIGTNLAGGQITIDDGAEMMIGNSVNQDTFTNSGGMLIEDGGVLSGEITLTAGDPLDIAPGGSLADATIVFGTIAGDGGVAWGTDILYDVLYAGSLTVAGTVEVEDGTSFIAAGGAALPAVIDITDSLIGGGTELSLRTAETFNDTTVDIGTTSTFYAYIAADAAITLAPSVTIQQDNTYAGIDSDGVPGSVDNQGNIYANFLDGTFVVAGLSSFTNDGYINVANGETLDLQTSFTQNADGAMIIGAGAVLEFSAELSLGAGAVIQFAAGSTFDMNGDFSGGTLDLNGANIDGGAIPGSGVFDDVTINDTPVTISGTVTFTDVTYVGSPVLEGELLLDGGDSFQPETLGGPSPIITLVAGAGTLDFVGGQTLDDVAIDVASGASSTPAIIMAGSGVADAAVIFGSGLLIDQNDGGAVSLQGTSDDGSSIDNEGSVLANQNAGTFTIQSLAAFTNDGGITVSNDDDLVVDAPFTENADGSFEVAGTGTVSLDAGVTLASGATLTLDANSDAILNTVSILGSPDGTSALVADGATLQGNGEIADVTVYGSPTIDGDLQLGDGVVFLGPPGDTGATPTLNLTADASTLDVLTSQTLSGLNLVLGSPDSGPSGPATLAAGLGSVDADVTLAAGVTLTQSGAFATLSGSSDGNSTLENDGQINAEFAGGLFSIASLAGFTNTGDFELQNGDSLNVAVPILNTGTVDDQWVATFADAVTGDGTILLGDNGVVTFDGSVASGQQVMLNDGLIVIDDPMGFSGTIANFGTNDALWFPNETVNNPTYDGNQLLFTDGSGSQVAIFLQDPYDFGPMQEKSDGSGGFFVGSEENPNLQCFAAGTRLATPAGEVAVEQLAAGDRVLLADGGAADIVWIGHRAVDAAQHPRPYQVWPVRVAAGAFGPGRPHRDLLLSPDHGVFVDDVLIPVKYLLNGRSIAQIPVGAITYFHVELAVHDILLAEGLAVESYLDIGDRSGFTNQGDVLSLFPDFSRREPRHALIWEAQGRAPLVLRGKVVERVRARIEAHGVAGSDAPAKAA